MPGFDRCDVSFPARQSPDFHLTRSLFLGIAGSQLLLAPGSIRCFLKEKNSFVAGGEYFFLAIFIPIEWPDIMGDVQIVADQLAFPWFFEGVRGAAKDIEGRAITLPPLRPGGFPTMQRRAEEF